MAPSLKPLLCAAVLEAAAIGRPICVPVGHCMVTDSDKISLQKRQEAKMSVKSTITAQFQQVAREQDRTLAPLSDELKLVQSGLDSLSFAIIVARLEDSLGVDPFNATEAVEFPVTFGDFVRLYERFAK
jgi:acyl carrier protein